MTARIKALGLSIRPPEADDAARAITPAKAAEIACRGRPQPCIPPDVVIARVTTTSGDIQPDDSVRPFLNDEPAYLVYWYSEVCVPMSGMPGAPPESLAPYSCTVVVPIEATTGRAFIELTAGEANSAVIRPWVSA